MMPLHRIHLRGPWQYQWLPLPADLPRADQNLEHSPTDGRVKMPADWQSLFGNQAGSVLFQRRFHRPTNLEPHERVYLVFDGVGGTGRVSLNDGVLGTIKEGRETIEFEITSSLQAGNLLTVELQFHPAKSLKTPGGLWGPVALEIRSG